jgi:hypothetical protein
MVLLLLSQHKMIHCLTKQISKRELLNNNNKLRKSNRLGRENTHDYIRKNSLY